MGQVLSKMIYLVAGDRWPRSAGATLFSCCTTLSHQINPNYSINQGKSWWEPTKKGPDCVGTIRQLRKLLNYFLVSVSNKRNHLALLEIHNDQKSVIFSIIFAL